MRDVLSRLRAALTPQAIALLLAMLLLAASLRRDTGASALERRIAQTLSSMEGAGRVQVTIRMKETAVSSSSLAGAQTQAVPCGAVAVAQGADDPLVEWQLREALCALLSLPQSAVSIVTGGK